MKNCINCDAQFTPVSGPMNLDRAKVGFILNDYLCTPCQTGIDTLRLVVTRDFNGLWQLESSMPLRNTIAGGSHNLSFGSAVSK